MAGPSLVSNRFYPRAYIQAAGPIPGGDSLLAVPNIAALQVLDDTTVDDGGVVSMLSLLDLWILDKTSPLAVDGITVVLPNSGVGRWIRMKIPNTTWQLQTTWHINEVTGNDENDGATAGTALKNYIEWERRVGDEPLGLITIYIDSTLNQDIEVNAKLSVSVGRLTFQGKRTVIYSSSFSATTPSNPSANQDGQITDAALPVSWSASGLVDKLCVITSGPNAGAAGWVVKDLGAKTARITKFYLFPGSYVDPAPGDTFDVVDLTTVNGEFKTLEHGSGGFLFDLRFVKPGGRALGVFGGEWWFFYTDFEGDFIQGIDSFTFNFFASRLDASLVLAGKVEAFLFASFLTRGFQATGPAGLVVLRESIGQYSALGPVGIFVADGAHFRIGSNGSYGVFDQPNPTDYALRVEPGSNALLSGYLWGTGNTFDYAIIVESNGVVVYDGARLPLAATAVVKDTSIAGLNRAYGVLPVNNVNKMAGIVLR